MPDDFRSLQDILKESEEFSKMRDAAKEYEVLEQFHNIFPELEKVARVIKIVKGTLYIGVDNAVWRNELSFKREVMREKINVIFGSEIVKNIRFSAK